MNSEEKPEFKQTEIGRIPGDWEVVNTVGLLSPERGALKIGPFGSQLKKEFLAAEGFKLYGQENIFENDFLLGERYITKERFELLRSCELRPGDLIISMMGTIGFVTIVPEGIQRGIMDSHLLRLRIDHTKYSARFLLYAFRSKLVQNQIDSLSVGTIMAGLSSRIIRMLVFPIPPLSEQQSIAKTLSNLDSKIELNQRMNKTLEAVGQAVFKRWFVDFEFPNEEDKPYKSSGGKVTESKLEEMPEGWTESSLGQLHCEQEDCVITGPFGSNLHASDYRETGTPLILVKHVKAGGISGDDMPLVGKHKFPEMKRYLLKIGDIVFTRVAVVGESAYIRKRNENWMISGQMLRVRANNDKINPRYLAQVFQQKTFKNQVSNYAVGSTRPSLNTKILLSFTFVLPPLKLQNAFSDLLESVDAKIENNLDEIDTLSSIRDSLMPRLMSGKIRVPVTEEKVGAS